MTQIFTGSLLIKYAIEATPNLFKLKHQRYPLVSMTTRIGASKDTAKPTGSCCFIRCEFKNVEGLEVAPGNHTEKHSQLRRQSDELVTSKGCQGVIKRHGQSRGPSRHTVVQVLWTCCT